MAAWKRRDVSRDIATPVQWIKDLPLDFSDSSPNATTVRMSQDIIDGCFYYEISNCGQFHRLLDEITCRSPEDKPFSNTCTTIVWRKTCGNIKK